MDEIDVTAAELRKMLTCGGGTGGGGGGTSRS